ncbi:hypothetical protein [Clostridium sp. Ade.TY]|uniref:hypothetical protein n=1 Tax=Clostridium sp. Ade.TY TaxID=1391647 RepID=UPI0003F598A5|nr:hypothetical protein [Clostridium sp. Ade.TY]
MLIKDLIELNPNTEIIKLQLYQDVVINKIKNYLNLTNTSNDVIIKNYLTAIKVGVCDEIERNKHKNIRTMTQGQRSITYSNSSASLSNDVKDLLPKPFVKLMG